VSEEISVQILNKMGEILRGVSALDVKVERLTHDLAAHQQELAALSECVAVIKLERASERGYVAGALAVGGIAGGVLAKVLF
jgi:nitrate/nitrite-specific signal transduction histidine kinase